MTQIIGSYDPPHEYPHAGYLCAVQECPGYHRNAKQGAYWDGGGQHHPAVDPSDPTVPLLKGMVISELARAIALELGLSRNMAIEIESRLYDRIVTDADHEAYVNEISKS